MGKSTEKHLFNHLENSKFHDEPCNLVLPWDGNRLSAQYRYSTGDWHDVSRIILNPAGLRAAWFPDANVAILPETEPVWDALRLAGLGLHDGSTLFTCVVRQELEEWLDKPHHHQRRAEAIRAGIANETWARKFGLQDNSLFLPAIFGYMRLFALRRFLARPAQDGLTLFGTDPEKKCDTMNAIANSLGPRAIGLAKKGRIDSEKGREININDELHCLIAICHSLITGRESVILTADKDFLEIFWKAQWFFDTHYRAYLAAKLVKSGEFGKPLGVLEDTRGYFDSQLTLYRRHTKHLLEVLPSRYNSVAVIVIYVAPEKIIHKIGFQFEREMLNMLDMRSKTHGRCTDLFGEENIHVNLGLLQVGLGGLCLGIGRDAGNWVQTNDTKTFLALLDQEHMMNCRERISRHPVWRHAVH